MPEDYDQVIEPGTEVFVDGELVCGFYPLEEDSGELLRCVRGLPYVREFRTSGMRARSVIFGYRPREPLRKNYCAASTLASKSASSFHMLSKWASVAERYYERTAPDVHRWHREWALRTVSQEWRIQDTLFTSGIVNKDTSHFYHKDNGNLAKSWNAMIVFSHDVQGGETVLPELRTALRYTKPAVVVMPAERLLHGVTPLKVRSSGYRYSVVFYSLTGMCHCMSPKEEMQRVRKLRTKKAHDRTSSAKVIENIRTHGDGRALRVLKRMEEEGKLDKLLAEKPEERTLEERIERLRTQQKSARARVVLRRLERKLAARNAAEGESE